MTPTEAMNAIEGRRFAALTNLASNLKTFVRIAPEQPEGEALSRAMTSEPTVVAEVLQRAAEDERESEGDAALATYLWLLSNHRRDFAQMVAGSPREWRPFFWTRKLADHLHLPERGTNGNGREATTEITSNATEDIEALHRKP